MDPMLDYQAELLSQKVKHYLITTVGRVAAEANTEEFYRAFCYALREEVMINWLASYRTFIKNDSRILYYMSMEYLPGRLLYNNINNIHALEIVKLVMKKMNRDFLDVLKREAEPGLGNGGLGRLASCYLDALATKHLPTRAYGLRYQYGIFEQELWNGVQVERPDCWLLGENPWEFRRDLRKVVVKFCGIAKEGKNEIGEKIHSLHESEEVWALPYDVPIIGYSEGQDFSVQTLRLWTTKESPRNFQLQKYNAGRLDQAAENTALTDVLYPSDHHDTGKRVRLKQEFLLVSASIQDIIRNYQSNHTNFDLFADKVRIQINDTHPALVIAELMRILTKVHHISWNKAWEITQQVTSYTNHTVLREALEEWELNLMNYLLPRQYQIIEKINQDFCAQVRTAYPNDEDRVRRLSIIENGRVRMAHLAIQGCHHVNGVARLHTDILKATVFKDFYDIYPDKFINVTNGVTQRRWLMDCNQELASFITARIGKGWMTDFSQIKELANFAAETKSQEEFLQIKYRNKNRLYQFLNTDNLDRDMYGVIKDYKGLEFDSKALLDVQVKRIHEYKRQLMNAIHLIMLYQELLENNTSRIKRVVLFGGKAAAGYETAKNVIRLVHCIARKVNHNPKINGQLKVVYVENYCVSKAELIIPAADLSEQISMAGMEASGTGNMKLSMNGALTIGTNDGANIEMKEGIKDQWWPFTFGLTADEVVELKARNTYNPLDICSSNPKIAKAVNALRDRSLAEDDSEHEALSQLYHLLIEGNYGRASDYYLVLKDLETYYETQLKVEELYRDQNRWAEYAIHNIAGMGNFSSDRSIQNYNDEIWHLTPTPPDPEILAKVREEYSEHDRCRIFSY